MRSLPDDDGPADAHAAAAAPPPGAPILRGFGAIARWSGALVLVVGALALVAWWRRVPPFGAGGASTLVMLPNTAAGFALGGAALLLLADAPPARWRRRVATALAAALALLGALALVQRLAGVGLGIDLLLFADAVRAHPWTPPGRVATNTALGMLCCGLALLLLDRRPGDGWRPAEPFAAVALLTAFLGLVGYAYHAESLYAFHAGGGMALSTAVAFFFLSLGTLAARAGHGVVSLVSATDASGIFLRRLLPAAIVVPAGLGWLWLELRDEALVTRASGVALFVAAIVAVFVTVLLVSARTVRQLDRQREEILRREQAARAEAEEANRAKADFLATMSHELRTPLNAIIGYADLLEMGLRGGLTDGQRQDVGRIRRSGQYLLGLINDTLNFARLEAGRVDITIADLPLDAALREMEALIAPQVRARHLRYRYEPCDPALSVRADRERLEQILVNLLGNACKFTEPGGEVSLRCERRVRHVRIMVHDTGRGIAPGKLRTIFEPFVQVDRHLTHESQQGVGLGLAISRDLARAMGGDLTVESELGVGSTFVLRLPRGANRDADAPDDARAVVA
jgi:signal transduction histidine kinase